MGSCATAAGDLAGSDSAMAVRVQMVMIWFSWLLETGRDTPARPCRGDWPTVVACTGRALIWPGIPGWSCPARDQASCRLAGRYRDHRDDPDGDADEEEDEQDDGHPHCSIHRGTSSASQAVMSRRPTPLRRRAPRAAALGGCRVSDRSLSSLRIASATMAITPAMTPTQNTRVIAVATAITMRSIRPPASQPAVPGTAGSCCVRARERFRGPCQRADDRLTSWAYHPIYWSCGTARCLAIGAGMAIVFVL